MMTMMMKIKVLTFRLSKNKNKNNFFVIYSRTWAETNKQQYKDDKDKKEDKDDNNDEDKSSHISTLSTLTPHGSVASSSVVSIQWAICSLRLSLICVFVFVHLYLCICICVFVFGIIIICIQCTMWLSFSKSGSRENLFLCSHFIEIWLFQTEYLEIVIRSVSLLVYIWGLVEHSHILKNN